MIDSIINKTLMYLSTPSVVGHEQFFMDVLEKDFISLGLRVHRHDCYISISGKDPLSAIICAHLDRHGLISIGDDEYVYAAQYMKEIKYGENNRYASQELENIARRFEGEPVYAYAPDDGTRLGDGVIEACNPCMLNGDALFFVQDMHTMDEGIPLAYARAANYGSNRLKGQIDNAISLGVIYALFEQGFQGTALLTTEEEIGKSWLHIKDYLEVENIASQSLIVLDTSPYTNQNIIEEGYIIFRNRDMSGVFSSELVKLLKARAENLNLPYQTKDQMLLEQGKQVSQLGSTELGRLIQGSDQKWNGATVQIPTLMYHTSSETTTTKAIENFFMFLHNILIEDRLEILRATKGE